MYYMMDINTVPKGSTLDTLRVFTSRSFAYDIVFDNCTERNNVNRWRKPPVLMICSPSLYM
jgi:hypothetical protein